MTTAIKQSLSRGDRVRYGLSKNAGQIWKLINSEGYYSLRAPDLMVAAAAAFVINGGRCAVISLDEKVASRMSNSWPEFLEEQGIQDFNGYLNEHALEVALALDSVLLGTVAQRECIEWQMSQLNTPKVLARLEARDRQYGLGAGSIKHRAQVAANALMLKHQRQEQAA